MTGLGLIIRRSLRQHALSTSITVLSTALACGLVISVFCVNKQAYDAFTGGPVGFDAVLGARGSQLSLVLNTVFHLKTSPGNIPWSLYDGKDSDGKPTGLKNHPLVELAIPYAVGDNYKGFRIVGTTDEIFTKFEYQEGKRFKLRPNPYSRFFKPRSREAVIGALVARRAKLKEGDKFNPYHGVIFDASKKHLDEYSVVGVLEPTNSPADRVIWIPIEGIFRMEGHVLRDKAQNEETTAVAGQSIPDKYKEISAIMLKFSSPQAGFILDNKINKQGNVATLAFPIGMAMAEFFDNISWVNRILELVAYLVVLVAAGSILASIYNTMNERRREFAILRALGAQRTTVFSAIVMEAAVIAFLGSLLGFGVYAGIMSGAAFVVREQTGVFLEVIYYHPVMIAAPIGMTILGALAGIVPAIKAYASDVATHLTPST